MGTPSAGPDEAVRSLSAGARQWTGRHAAYLDSPAAHAGLPVTPRVKALLQLALLRHFWERAAPGDSALAEVTAVVERVWQRPDFLRLLALEPRYAQQFQLMYAALAPASVPSGKPRAVLDRLAADGYLAPRRKPPYVHLSTRFYADLAGAGHRLWSYRELYAASVVPRAAAVPVEDLDACEVTHTVFYLGDFGFRDTGLAGEDREHALRVVERLTDHCVAHGDWDYTAKLLLAQFCLGADPLRTPSGAAGLRMLARAMTPDGAIPGKSAAARATAAATPVEMFRKSYQSTLVTALATLIVTGGRPRVPAAAGATAAREAR